MCYAVNIPQFSATPTANDIISMSFLYPRTEIGT